MVKRLCFLSAFFLLLCALASCRSEASNINTETQSAIEQQTVSGSEMITEPDSFTETDTHEVETVPSPPSDETEGESMIEPISTYQNPILSAATL